MIHRRNHVKLEQGSVLAVVFLVVLALAYSWAVIEAQGGALPYDEAEAQAIDRMIMCPVCPAETIDQAQVELARQMKQKVREMLAAGASREEILSFFVDRYGTDVLAAPPKSGFNLIAWVVPPLVAGAGLGAVWLVLRSMTARRSREPAAAGAVGGPPIIEADLKPYLWVVDQQLGMEGKRDTQGRPQDLELRIPRIDNQPGQGASSVRPPEKKDLGSDG